MTTKLLLALILFSSAPEARRMADGKRWTLHNLNTDKVPSYCYEDSSANCRTYGRLYTWDAAVQACPTLGRGWKLPTDEEWRQLAKQYGGISADSADGGKAAYKALMSQLGGGRGVDGKYARLDAHGFYWTATEQGKDLAVYYNFGKGGLALHRQDEGEKARAFSVRCVRQ